LNGGKEWPAAAAVNASDGDLRQWLLGGGELRCSLEEDLRFFGWRWELQRRGLAAASCEAATAATPSLQRGEENELGKAQMTRVTDCGFKPYRRRTAA
jgi:hypothetical protein